MSDRKPLMPPPDRRNRWSRRCRQEHRRPRPGAALRACSTWKAARCTAPSPSRRLTAGVATGDAAALEALAHSTQVRLEPGLDGNRVLLDWARMSPASSARRKSPPPHRRSASHPPIRRWLVRLQQALGAQGNVVMEGRDIGTVVFPHAPVKIFLDASPEKRGERRYEQNRAGDQDVQQTGRHGSGNAVAHQGARRDPRARPSRPHPRRLAAAPRSRRHRHRFHRPHARASHRASRSAGGRVSTSL